MSSGPRIGYTSSVPTSRRDISSLSSVSLTPSSTSSRTISLRRRFLQLFLDQLQEVATALVVEVELGVARDAEGRHVADLLPREEILQVGPDHVLEQHVHQALDARRPHQPRQPAGHLHHRQPRLVVALGRPEQHRQVEAQAGEHRKRPRGVDRERRERGQHLALEEARERGARVGLEIPRPHQPQAALGERRQDLAGERGVELLDHRVRALRDRLELLRRREPGDVGRGVALGERVLERGHADHEELVQVARHDAGELEPLERRVRGVAGLLEHAAVELEPRELAVQEQLGLALSGFFQAPPPTRFTSGRPSRGSRPCCRTRRSACRRARAPPAARA